LSREFFEKLAQHLEPDGIAIVNTIMKIPLSNEDPVLGSILKTLSAVFPQLIAVQIQNAPSDSMANVVFLAAKGPHFNDKIAATFTNLPSLNGDRRFSLKRFDNSSVLRGAGQLLTDDWNPIEHYLLAYNHTH
jgi:spermidine synthase